jgi:hypothetical protein
VTIVVVIMLTLLVTSWGWPLRAPLTPEERARLDEERQTFSP